MLSSPFFLLILGYAPEYSPSRSKILEAGNRFGTPKPVTAPLLGSKIVEQQHNQHKGRNGARLQEFSSSYGRASTALPCGNLWEIRWISPGSGPWGASTKIPEHKRLKHYRNMAIADPAFLKR